MEKKEKKYIGSKALIILISLIIMFNGLGLVVAGARVKNKKWIWFGIGYIVTELILSFTGIGSIIAVVLYFVSIIHTCLICSEYGHLLALRENGQNLNAYAKNKQDIKRTEEKQNFSEIKEDFVADELNEKEETSDRVNFKDLVLSIGSANIEGENRDNMSIQIIDESGKVYRFTNKGNNIVSFQVGSGKIKNYV